VALILSPLQEMLLGPHVNFIPALDFVLTAIRNGIRRDYFYLNFKLWFATIIEIEP